MTDTVRVPRAWLEAFRRDTDPTEPIADNGGTVWDMFCHEAIAMLAASPQGEGSSVDADTHRAAEGAVIADLIATLNQFAAMIGHIEDWMDDDYCPSWSPFIPVAAYRKAHAAVAAGNRPTPPAEPQWIKHDGGPNPVPGEMVEVKFRSGRTQKLVSCHYLDCWDQRPPTMHDIIAYRVTEGVKT